MYKNLLIKKKPLEESSLYKDHDKESLITISREKENDQIWISHDEEKSSQTQDDTRRHFWDERLCDVSSIDSASTSYFSHRGGSDREEENAQINISQ